MAKHFLTGFSGKIFFEAAIHKESSDTIILLPGFPSSNNMKDKINFFYELGFNVYAPRYPGSYQSDGFFLEGNLIEDLSNFVENVNKPIINLWDLKETTPKIRRIFVFGESFSGAISCALANRNSKISKLVLFSPLWDFKKHNINSDEEDLSHLIPFVKRAYNNLYRIKFDSLVDIIGEIEELNFNFYSKKLHQKLLVFHDNTDKIVSINHTLNAKKIINFDLYQEIFGHGLSVFSLEKFKCKILQFLNSN